MNKSSFASGNTNRIVKKNSSTKTSDSIMNRYYKTDYENSKLNSFHGQSSNESTSFYFQFNFTNTTSTQIDINGSDPWQLQVIRELKYEEQRKTQLNNAIINIANQRAIGFITENERLIVKFPYESILVESFANNVILKMQFKNKIFAILNFPDDLEYSSDLTAIFSIFENDELIVRNIKPLDVIETGLINFINDSEVPNLAIT